MTEAVSPDGEYEHFYKIAAADVPASVIALGGAPGTDVIDLLKQHWSGDNCYRLGPEIESSRITHHFSSYP